MLTKTEKMKAKTKYLLRKAKTKYLLSWKPQTQLPHLNKSENS